MAKTVIMGEDRLLNLKEELNGVGDGNVANTTTIDITEARPEVDKYEIGDEGSNPPVGGNFYHVNENLDFEVNSSDINLSSFKRKSTLAPNIWDDEDTLNSRVRLRLLDIADDFWKFVNLTWVKPKGIIITGSICNYNWSQYSDIDLHIIVDFNEIDEKTNFVRDYLDAKKNEWNETHSNLKIHSFPIELYVQDMDDELDASGIYDLEENKWVRKPNMSSIGSIGLNKFYIKDKAAEIMTIIDDMYNTLDSTDDSYDIESIGEDAKYLWKRVKKMRKKSLEKNGESGSGNIIYKILRRTQYLDKLWKLSNIVYDKVNSINENIEKNADIFALAKERFGVTNDIRECGYVLLDGSMLDFTGKHMLTNPSDASYLSGRRSIDHREIADLNYEIDGNTKNGLDISMEKFIRNGAIRIHCSNTWSSINLFVKPTKEQINVLLRLIQYSKGCVTVEIGDGNESLSYAEYDYTKPRRVINDIIRYFYEGINLIGNVKESTRKHNKNKELIKEYLEKDHNLPLYKYFKWASTASSCEKARDLAYQCSYYIGEYITTVYYRYRKFEELLDENGEFNYEDDTLVEKFLEYLQEYKLCDHFISLMNEVVKDYRDLPTWMHCDFVRLVKNEWCIHFGKDSDSIAKYGFTGGTEDISQLAYTNAGEDKPSVGYDFAFTIDDRHVDRSEYGDEAVIFRTSGVEIYHYGDNEEQVIFWGPNAKSFIPIKYDMEKGDWCVYGQNGQILKMGKPSEIAAWATENLPQYRKQIMTGKNGYIPMMGKWNHETNKYERIPYPLYKNESVLKYIKVLKESSINEEVVADGNSEHNPYAKRWKSERKALKDFICNFGTLMQSKENDKMGRLYKCFYDKYLSNLIGFNYCLCVQWDEIKMKPKSTIYIRACDRFTPNIRRNVQYDVRGYDNQIGTRDDFYPQNA